MPGGGNQEPEGPDIKSAKIVESKEESTGIKPAGKWLKIKGIIACATGILVIGMYLFYFFYLESTGTKLSELYFIASGVGISVFTGLLFTFFRNIYRRTVLLFTSVFYALLEIIYIWNWIINGKPYVLFKVALIIGLFTGIIYFIYDTITNDPRKHN